MQKLNRFAYEIMVGRVLSKFALMKTRYFTLNRDYFKGEFTNQLFIWNPQDKVPRHITVEGLDR